MLGRDGDGGAAGGGTSAFICCPREARFIANCSTGGVCWMAWVVAEVTSGGTPEVEISSLVLLRQRFDPSM